MAPSETTQILFDSAALHSLKRDQLVKLCKLHGLKASGKNVELVERLKAHALTLQPSGDDDDEGEDIDLDEPGASTVSRSGLVRPSEQWEVVMDDIEEADEQGSLNSLRTTRTGHAGEFGTVGSKASSVGSSMKAFATSIGFKSVKSVAPSMSSLTVPESGPESGLILPVDHLTLGNEDPIPGDAPRAGIPAPIDSRLSLGADPTSTTIRLVSAVPTSTASRSTIPMQPGTPQLKPFATSFDLDLGSPGTGVRGMSNSIPVWPLSPRKGAEQRLYPTFTAEELASINSPPPNMRHASHDQTTSSLRTCEQPTTQTHFTPKPSKTPPRPRNDIDDMFSPSKPGPSNPQEDLPTTAVEAAKPFVFGTPHRVSNAAFRSAADSVLEEMNRRLSGAGASNAKLNSDFLTNRPKFDFSAHNLRDKATVKGEHRFADKHATEFAKMDSITSHFAARRTDQNTAPAPARSKKRKSEAVASRERKRAIPGGFGNDEEEQTGEDGDAESEENRRMSKRVRVDEAGGRRLSLVQAPNAEPAVREREAVRRALEVKREKRRSGGRPSGVHGRASGVKGQPSGRTSGVQGQKPKAATPRFGFIASAKSMVKSLWSGGAKPSGSSTTGIPAPGRGPVKKELPHPEKAKNKAAIGDPEKTARNGTGKQEASGAESAIANGSVKSNATGRGLFKPISKIRGDQARAPIPSSFTAAPTSSGKPAPVAGHRRANSVPIARTSAAPYPNARTKSVTGGHARSSSLTSIGSISKSVQPTAPERGYVRGSSVSSATTKPVALQPLPAVNSLGTRKTSVVSSLPDTGAPSSLGTRRGTAMSRLLAPTASSLAKTRNSILTTQNHTPHRSHGTSPSKGGTLTRITKSPPATRKDLGRIFDRPLNPSMIPAPVKPTSFGAAAAALASPAKTALKPKETIARKPRVSRSRVIAKLGAQRAATAASSTSSSSALRSPASSVLAPRVSGHAALRVRSSVGTATRRSYGGSKRGSDAVVMSAKKRIRQSEQARRRTRAGASAVGAGANLFTTANTSAMDIEDD